MEDNIEYDLDHETTDKEKTSDDEKGPIQSVNLLVNKW